MTEIITESAMKERRSSLEHRDNLRFVKSQPEKWIKAKIQRKLLEQTDGPIAVSTCEDP